MVVVKTPAKLRKSEQTKTKLFSSFRVGSVIIVLVGNCTNKKITVPFTRKISLKAIQQLVATLYSELRTF